MPLHFLLHNRDTYEKRYAPALSGSWRQRLGPCQKLCESLLPALESQANRHALGETESMLHKVARGLSFDRAFWRALVGEILWFAAEEVPELETMPEMLCELLAAQGRGDGLREREQYAPIEQAHFGSRDVCLGGGYYCPETAGFNNAADIERLAKYLESIDPASWQATPGIDDDDLAYAREWFPALQTLYRQAHERGQIMVCEVL